jgi:hypothetical protein
MEGRWINSFPLCAVLVLFVSPSSAQGRELAAQQSNTPSIRQELIDLQKALVNAQEHGDAEFVKNAVADDFTSVETNGSTSDKSDFVHDVHPSERPGPAPILYDFKVIQLDEGCAIVTYKAVFPGNQMERYQHLSDTWVKQGNEWKLKFQQSTLNLWSAHDLD